jgi:hypothetical protein
VDFFIASERSVNETFREAVERGAAVLRPIMFRSNTLRGYRPFLFAADSTGRESTVIARHQGFWLRPWIRDQLGNLVLRGVSLPVPAAEGIRYVGMVDIREEELAAALEFAREHGQAAILLSKEDLLSNDWIGTLVERIYPPSARPRETRINWFRSCVELSRLGMVTGRVTGQFDDREVLIALYGRCQTMSSLFEEVNQRPVGP